MKGLVHFPFILHDNPNSGSGVRPQAILKGFADANIHVDVLAGKANERKRQMRALMSRGGLSEFDWIYVESSTIPMALAARDLRIVPHPFFDANIWRQARSHGVPVGLFYRDVYWRFPFLLSSAWLRTSVRNTFYRLEWQQIERNVDHLFLPTLQMNAVLPRPWPQGRLSALPPGCEVEDAEEVARVNRGSGVLRLLYVGGISPPLYDLRPMFAEVAKKPFVELTLCCREEEWSRHQAMYKPFVRPNIVVTHGSGDALRPLYSEADAVIITRMENPYLNFAMPVKVFEAIGWGKPIITSGGTAVADFVRREGLGWVTDSAVELDSLLTRLARGRRELLEVQTHVMAMRARHTWSKRAEQIARTLVSYKR